MKEKGLVGVLLFLICHSLLGFGPGGGADDLWAGGEEGGYSFGSSVVYKDSENEAGFSEKTEFSSSLSGSIHKDEDESLYAPPPGEDGNPQKMLPVGKNEWQAYFLFFLAGICYMQGKSKRE